MKQKVILKALRLGIRTELVATLVTVVCLSFRDWRASIVSAWDVVGALIQLPGWYLELSVFRWGIPPDGSASGWSFAIIFVLQALFWSALWFLRLAWLGRRSSTAEPVGSGNPG